MSKRLPKFEKTVVLPDIHFPFHSRADLKEAYALIRAEKPSLIVHVGDVYENYCFSVHDKANVVTPKSELLDARKCFKEMWETIRKIAPAKTQLTQIMGNHDLPRLIKKAQKVAPEFIALMEVLDAKQLWEADGVQLINDWREGYDTLIYGNKWRFIHGYLSTNGAHIARNLEWNVAHGHLHRGDVASKVLEDGMQYELDAGFLGDMNALVFNYTPQTMKNWTPGVGLIDHYGPRFVSFR